MAQTAQFTVQASLFISDATLFNQILAENANHVSFDASNAVLYGVSPLTLQTTYGGGGTVFGQKDNPTSDDMHHVGLYSFSSTSVGQVLGHAIDPLVYADGTQTLGGVSYTDANGTVFSSVTYEWQVTLELFTLVANTWNQQVVTWTGDNTSARVIPTTFALNTGSAFVAVFPKTANAPMFRHSLMTTTASDGVGNDALGGIMAFQSGGFTVTNHGSLVPNGLGISYTAIVFQCNDTGGGSLMSLGSYIGQAAISTNGTCSIGSAVITAAGFTANDIARPITVGGTFTSTIIAVNPGVSITLAATLTLSGLQSLVLSAGGQRITLTNTLVLPSQVWVFGRAWAFWTEDMPAGQSTALYNEAKPLTGIISSTGLGFFIPGSDNNVNGGITYYYVVFHIPVGDTIRNLFRTYTANGTGSNVAVTGFGFAPGFATARYFDAADTAGEVWRSTVHTGTISTQFTGTSNASTGIVALGTDGVTLGTAVLPSSGKTMYGFAVKASGSGSGTPDYIPTVPTWVAPAPPIPNPDGTTTVIFVDVAQQTPPGGTYTPRGAGTPQWWCNAAFGYSAYQIDSPGAGWVACSGPATANGWYQSAAGFGSPAIVVSGGVPADPRAWTQIGTWATGTAGMLGGSPGAACVQDNCFVYPGTNYTPGTTYPPVRIFNGRADRELCRLPPTTANAVPQAVLSMLAANGTVFLSSWDTGTSSADWRGRVFHLDNTTGVLTPLGAQFAAGEMPYALAWHMGRLWCGTNNGIGTVGKVYFFRPGIDTAWTLDHSTSTDSAGGVDSLVSHNGKLYVGTDNAAASRGKVLVRDTAGAYTVSHTGAGGTAQKNNGYLQLTVFGSNLYAAYWNPDTPAVSLVEKFDGTSWTTVYTGVSGTNKPFIQLVVDDGVLYAFAGSELLAAAIVSTANGTSWTDDTAELPETNRTLLPMFGAVVV